MRSFLITGGAGFIGSNIAVALAERYPQDKVIVADYLGDKDKWRNLAGFPPDEIITPPEMIYWLEANKRELEAIIHMGALTNTTQTQADAALEVNVTLPKVLREWCIANNKRIIYGSSAAVYGGGEHGFEDDISLNYMRKLHPLTTYGWSKYSFDYLVAKSLAREEEQPKQWVGLRFFNVYGPNEYHKGDQGSVLSQIFPHVKAHRPVSLFKSEHPDYANGAQLRDFVYIKDCVNIILWFLENPKISGMFNIGTGQARSFADLAKAAFAAIGAEPQIHYVDMPQAVRKRYQYFTQASVTRLREAGYNTPFTSLEEGVKDYILHYLNTDNPYLK